MTADFFSPRVDIKEKKGKYEILESSNHELVHGSNNSGKICDIDKNKLEEGTYTLKVYTDDFVITSDITIDKEGEATGA